MVVRSPLSFRIGDVVAGKYRIDAPPVEGGMALVYQATDMIGRRVALKMISSRYANDPEFRERFHGEAEKAARIDHPNVVPVLDYGESNACPYIAMPYINGRNLREMIAARGKLDPAGTVAVIEQVAAALDAAHALGIVHRDVKPANILVEESTSHVFLADFGIAKALDEDRTKTSILGTEFYLAPERRRGESTKLSDIYSLGVILWEALAGFDVPPLATETASGRRAVSEDLTSVVRKAVELDPACRYQSAGELARAAREALPSETGPVYNRRGPFHEPLSTMLCPQVIKLCDRALDSIGNPTARMEIRRVRATLGEPLTIAIAGGAGVGKSTIVNALLEAQVAETGAGGTTRHVTWYRHGPPRAELVMRGGERRPIPFVPRERLPDVTEVAPTDVTALEVYLEAELLESVTLVDTPGIDASGSSSAAALSVLGVSDMTEDVSKAEALLFAIAADAEDSDHDLLDAFHRRFRGTHASAVNAIGILTRADTRVLAAPAGRPAEQLAEQARAALGQLVTAMVPVYGLLGETVNADRLGDEDTDAVLALSDEQRTNLISGETHALDEEPAGISRLRGKVGQLGLRCMAELAQSGQLTTVEAKRTLRELSGIGELTKHLDRLRLRSDVLKADTALRELESLYWRHKHELQQLYDEIAELRARGPDMYLLPLISEFDRCARGEVALDASMLQEMERLLTGRTLGERVGLDADVGVGDVRAAAKERLRAWRTYGVVGRGGTQVALVAGVVANAYGGVLDSLEPGEDR
jgi:predicted Ser/Thr protein kinase